MSGGSITRSSVGRWRLRCNGPDGLRRSGGNYPTKAAAEGPAPGCTQHGLLAHGVRRPRRVPPPSRHARQCGWSEPEGTPPRIRRFGRIVAPAHLAALLATEGAEGR